MKESSSRNAGDGSHAACQGSGGAGASTQSGGLMEGRGQGRGCREKCTGFACGFTHPLSSAHCPFSLVAPMEAAHGGPAP